MYTTYKTSPRPAEYYGYSSASPSPSPGYAYYTSRTAPPPRMHTRHQSSGDYQPMPRGAAYPSPRYNSTGYYSTRAENTSPYGNPEYVSHKAGKSPRNGHGWAPAAASKRRASHSYRTSFGESDEDEYLYDAYVYNMEARARQDANDGDKYSTYRGHGTDQYYYYPQTSTYYDRDDTPIYASTPTPGRSPQYEPERHTRPRRASASAAHARPSAAPRPSSSSKKAPPPVRKATEADARRHHIPSGYSLKNWDPSEEPFLLLGSVFDANALGKWIYDWTVYRHGPATPISDMAGELWLLLIQLAGKVKRAEESMPRIRSPDNKDMMEEFIDAGNRLSDKLQKLLKSCENPMLKAGKKSRDGSQLGKNAGTEFVDSIFGRDRQLENTEKFMSSVRLWNMRFDANCEDVIRKPYA